MLNKIIPQDVGRSADDEGNVDIWFIVCGLAIRCMVFFLSFPTFPPTDMVYARLTICTFNTVPTYHGLAVGASCRVV